LIKKYDTRINRSKIVYLGGLLQKAMARGHGGWCSWGFPLLAFKSTRDHGEMGKREEEEGNLFEGSPAARVLEMARIWVAAAIAAAAHHDDDSAGEGRQGPVACGQPRAA